MWVFLSRRLRTWVLLGVALPLIGVLARKLAERLEAQHGPTRTSRALHQAGDLAGRRGVGPLAPARPVQPEPASRWRRRSKTG